MKKAFVKITYQGAHYISSPFNTGDSVDETINDLHAEIDGYVGSEVSSMSYSFETRNGVAVFPKEVLKNSVIEIFGQ